jgi:DNA-binding winged helix-turn-helix (wHTH) protein
MDVKINIINDVILNMNDNKLFRGDKEQFLTEKEKRLLLALKSGGGNIVSHREIAVAVWPERPIVIGVNNITQLIFKLRRKFFLLDIVDGIVTEKGLGYRLNESCISKKETRCVGARFFVFKYSGYLSKCHLILLLVILIFIIVIHPRQGLQWCYNIHIYHTPQHQSLHENKV